MNVYLETSAVLRDLLEGESANEIREILRAAAVVVTSRLTIAELGRVLGRMRVLDPMASAAVTAREAEWMTDSELWFILPVEEDVWARCARPFPHEPVRTLDGLHLATIEKLVGTLEPLVVVSTDDRIRRNAAAMGLQTLP